MRGRPGPREDGAAQQREKLFQMGVFISLMMVLLDGGNHHPITIEEIPIPAEESGLKQLKQAMSTQEGDGRNYPQNVSGRYHGNWSRNDRKLSSNKNVSSVENKLQFKLTSNHGPFAIQVFQEPLVGLPDISMVRGYFQMLGESEPLRHQLTSSVQGVFFHKYGRVSLVTSQDRMFLKGSKSIELFNTTDKNVSDSNASEPPLHQPPRQVHNEKEQRISRKLAASSSSSFINKAQKESHETLLSLKQSLLEELHSSQKYLSAHSELTAMVKTIEDSFVHGRLLSALETIKEQEQVDIGEETSENKPHIKPSPPKIGLSIGSAASTNDMFVYHLPGSSASPTNPKSLSPSTTSRCLFLLNLKVGPSCEKCNKNNPPKSALTLEGRIRSDNCKVDISLSSEAYRIDWERAAPKAAKYSLYITIACFAQIVCLFVQLHFSETSSSAAQVSILTIGIQAVLDAIECVSHLLICAFLPQLFTPFASIAFLKLVIFIVIEMRYIVVISHHRDPQRFGGINQLRQEWALIHLRFYFALFVTILSLWILRNYIDVLIFIAYSFWIPQIIQNVIKGHRKPLHDLYLYGISFSRLLLPIYIFGCPSNLIYIITGSHFKPRYYMCFILIIWVGIQCWVLKLQHKLGSHFLIPARFLPPVYNYARPIPASVLENLRSTPSSSMTAIKAGSPSHDALINMEEGGKDSEDDEAGHECSICYQSIDLDSTQPMNYMLTPCDHLFHTACLERWMEQKLECPICRHSLPPTFPS